MAWETCMIGWSEHMPYWWPPPASGAEGSCPLWLCASSPSLLPSNPEQHPLTLEIQVYP